MIIIWRTVALLFVLTSAASGAEPAATTAQRTALNDCTVRAAADAGFNGIVRLSHNGDVVVSKSFGMSDAAAAVPIAAATRFNIASVGKMFTAVAIGMLAERGKLELAAPIGRYLPGIDTQFATITVRQLLQHTSGLGDYFNPASVSAINAARTANDLLPLALGSPPAFPPGSRVAYSNSGYVVLGAIIEKLSGTPWTDFVQNEILSPLGMNGTRFTGDGAADALTRMTLDGRVLARPELPPIRTERASPAGGTFSTASDMALFFDALATERLVKAGTLAQLFRPRPRPPARIGHNGGTPGANAEAWFYPDTGWQMIVLSNYDPPGATRMAAVLEAAMLSENPAQACTAALAAPAPEMPGLVIRR